MISPKISIITPVLNLISANRESCFRQMVYSINNQDYDNIEHIVVDGGSVDGTIKLIEEYSTNGCLRYISELDTGIYSAMNKGILESSGKYIAFLNSDDFYCDNSAISCASRLLTRKKADFCGSATIILQQNGIDIHGIQEAKMSNIYKGKIPFCHQSMLVKRSVLIKEQMFNTQFKIASDYDFIARLFNQKYKGIIIPGVFVAFRLGGISQLNEGLMKQEYQSIYARIAKKKKMYRFHKHINC